MRWAAAPGSSLGSCLFGPRAYLSVCFGRASCRELSAYASTLRVFKAFPRRGSCPHCSNGSLTARAPSRERRSNRSTARRRLEARWSAPSRSTDPVADPRRSASGTYRAPRRRADCARPIDPRSFVVKRGTPIRASAHGQAICATQEVVEELSSSSPAGKAAKTPIPDTDDRPRPPPCTPIASSFTTVNS
jgi:hypothetical protein